MINHEQQSCLLKICNIFCDDQSFASMSDINDFDNDDNSSSKQMFSIERISKINVDWSKMNQSLKSMKQELLEMKIPTLIAFVDLINKDFSKSLAPTIVGSILSEFVSLYEDPKDLHNLDGKEEINIIIANIGNKALENEDGEIKKYFEKHLEKSNEAIANLVSMVDSNFSEFPDKLIYNSLYNDQCLLRSQFVLKNPSSNIIELFLELPKINCKKITIIPVDIIYWCRYHDAIAGLLCCLDLYTDDKQFLSNMLDKKNYQEFYTDMVAKLGLNK